MSAAQMLASSTHAVFAPGGACAAISLAQTTLVWGAARWLGIAAPLLALLLLLILWGYWGSNLSRGMRLLAATLKMIGIAILALCLLEPLFSGTRARPGANVFIVLADNSQSMTLHDRDAAETRSQQIKNLLAKPSQWLARIGQDFDLRQYAFDTQLRAETDLQSLNFDGGASNLGGALRRLTTQYRGRPLAGMILLTDGTATDTAALESLLNESTDPAHKLPPIYPVVIGGQKTASDINVQQIAVTQADFEDAPVTITAQASATGFAGQTIAAQLVDELGKVLEEQPLKVDQDGLPITVRFRLKPENPGISFYRVRAAAAGKTTQLDSVNQTIEKTKADNTSEEATLANNTRLTAVDRGKGPYRVLYLAGRPNWEFKFLQRALQADDQIHLTGLLRIAKREPKFNYIGRGDDRSNPLFRGFEGHDKEQVEQYDQPVMVRIGLDDAAELRGGFPKTADELYAYHAIIIDDLEAEFFTQDQMQLIKEFVRDRGGGLLMLGGQESFKNGKFDRTPIGDLLPVYVDQVSAQPADAHYRMTLTREGWLEPWVRLRAEENSERGRLESMPAFQTLNPVRGIKPGATVLASATTSARPSFADTPGNSRNENDARDAHPSGSAVPALVEQRFGHGRSAALLIGDLWRWSMHRQPDSQDDQPKAWRQIVRWLVSEVPRRVEISIEPRHDADEPDGMLTVGVRVRDPAYAPLENAAVTVRITTPDGKPVDLTVEPSAGEAGLYEAAYMPRLPGAYRALATATGPDGKEIANLAAGWASDPAADEFRDLKPNRDLLDRLAKNTGGQIVPAADLEKFAASLPTRHADITEPYIRPIWHQPWVFLLAIVCLTAEWGLRRWKGMP